MIKVLELFAGIGACSKALERLNIDYEIVDAVENDKFAIASFNAIHSTNFECQDIRDWDKDIEVDLIMHGSPCQDFSVAGKQAGGDKDSGTRSSLMYETLRIVEKIKPKYVIWENVKNLLSKKHRHNFDAYLEAMEKLGYKNYYQVLNAKHYGVPQNRERVFTVSILDGDKYLFPEPITLEKKLKDVLEKEVDERYYLTDKTMKTYCRDFGSKGKMLDKEKYSSTLTASMGGVGANVPIIVDGKLDIKGQDQIKRVYDSDGVSPTLSTMQGGNRQPKIVEDFYKNRNPDNPNDRTTGAPTKQRLEPKFDGTTNTITTVQKDNYVATPYRIRKLTPKECWRLMGFDDTDFRKAEKVNSNTQLYKQAGNSIVVNVLEAILKNLMEIV